MRFQNKEYHQTEIRIQHVDIDGQLRKDNGIYSVCTQLMSFLMHEAKAESVKGEIEKSEIIADVFNTPLLVIGG